MTVGYPDYARLSLAGGYQLIDQANYTPPYDTNIFQGYVGLWPFVNVFISMLASSDHGKLVLNYGSDSTFSTIVGFRYLIRGGSNFSITQYANLSDWLAVFLVTESGTSMEFANLSVFANQGPATPLSLESGDVPFFQFNAAIAATTTSSFIVSHCRPGSVSISIAPDSTSWFVEVSYFDFGSNSYLLLTHISSNTSAHGGVWTIGLPDTPIEVSMRNGDASAQFMRVGMVLLQ